MDKQKAKSLAKEIIGTTLNGYEVIELINNGKSAAVFKAKKGNDFFALKIFDNELIERFGHEIQTKRIKQEIALKNHNIDNLVKIYDGGYTRLDSQTYYFIVMELIDGINLKDFIISNSYDQDFIIKVLEKLTATTEQLLTKKQIAHRDIKPENIMVDNNKDIILMDLGVLKLIGVKSFSDEEEKSFVGTLRYAPPEFLLRTEEDTIDGWRAINLYQIGATLHDLIMKKELFYDKIPYTNLVIAIKDDIPNISNYNISFELLQLTKDMLAKDWKTRIMLVTIKRIQDVLSIKPTLDNPLDQGIKEIFKIRSEHECKFNEIEKLKRTKEEIRSRQEKLAENLTKVIDECFKTIKNKGVYTAFEKSKCFQSDNNDTAVDVLTHNYFYELSGELKFGFPRSLFIFVSISIDKNNYTEIDLCGIFPPTIAQVDIDNYSYLIKELSEGNQKHNTNHGFPTINAFKGISDFNLSIINQISTKIVKLIAKALKIVKKDVQYKLQSYENALKTNRPTTNITSVRISSIIINKL